MDDKLSVAVLVCLVFAILTAWIGEPWPSYCLYAIVFSICVTWLLGRLLQPMPLRMSPLVWILSAIVAWGMGQLLLGLTVNRWQTMNAVLFWLANTVLFFLSNQLFSNSVRRDRFLKRLLWLGLIVALTAVFQLFTAEGKIFWLFRTPYSGFIMGPFPYHNHFAAFVVLILPIALNVSVRDRGRQLSYGLIVGALAAAVVASASRSGAALVGLEIAAGLIMTFRRTAASLQQRMGRIMVLICLIAVSGTIAGWDVLWERFHHGDSVRLRLAESSVEMVRSAPWIGSGLGTWPSAYPMYAHFDDGLFANQAHSDWLQWSAEGGIPFALALLGFGVAISIPAVRSIWAIGVPVVLIQCFIDYPLQKPAIAAVFFVLAGALAAQRSPVRPRSPQSDAAAACRH